jgi:hypothetical protein
MFRAGDLVEVRSKEEILRMLTPDGRLQRLPFMPEMLKYCGRRFRVANVAHKTCDTATLLMGRRMRNTVFLEDLRCDGSAHGGCEARCLLFWRTEWLKPVDVEAATSRALLNPGKTPCTEEHLSEATCAVMGNGERRYFCQATEHWAASEPLRPLALWHFIEDIRTGNSTFKEVVRVVGLHLVWKLRQLARGYRTSVWFYAWLHQRLTGRPDPFREGAIPAGMPTPEEKLDLQPGDLVEVKTHDEILQTLCGLSNRGMKYNSEMTPACGGQFRVAQRVSKIIEERSGQMITMKSPCITLEGVYCRAHYTSYSLLCTRRAPPYFREIWLRRVEDATGAPTAQDSQLERATERISLPVASP